MRKPAGGYIPPGILQALHLQGFLMGDIRLERMTSSV